MRFVATLLALVAIALVARADGPVPAKKTQPVGFDHAVHGQKAPGIDCAKCHVLAGGLVTKPPGHASCFTAACHAGGTKLDKLDPDRVKLCITCHAETALVLPADAKALAATKVTTGIEHGVQFGHNSHPKPQCATCHDVRAGVKPQRRPHDRCIACHGDKAADKTFAIGACEKCHPRGTERPRFTDNQIVVTSAFSHAKHATRGAAKCATCHASLAGSDARQLPRPGLATCTTEGCHDGKAAFNADASCTKCHKDAPKTSFKVARPGEAFSHEKHEPRSALPCASCHPLNKTGEVLVANHAACANGKCHQNEMGQRNPKICNACHDGTEPWRPLKADKLPAETTEFGATLDHKKHGTNCTSCHSLTTTRTELRAPRGHRACTTAGCHATTGGPAPQITACESCHIKNLDETRRAARFGATWSVRQMFVHGTHTSKAGEIACVKCHDDLGSPTVLSLAAPAKKSCATEKCHDGTGGTFKVTGTSCTKCHRGAAK
jgi:c(7)-type cytochrome triheme protein